MLKNIESNSMLMHVHGMAVANRGASRNPESLDFYEKMKEEFLKEF